MVMITDSYWNTLHRERPLWYACVWNACATLVSELEGNAGRNLPPGELGDGHSSAAIRMRSRIFSLVERQKAEIDLWMLLLLALEDPTLAQTSPASFTAVRQHMNAAYLLRKEFAHRLAGELVRFWAASGEGLVMNSLPPADPLPNRDALPPHLQGSGSVSLTMGTKRANQAFGDWQTLVRQEWGAPQEPTSSWLRP